MGHDSLREPAESRWIRKFARARMLDVKGEACITVAIGMAFGATASRCDGGSEKIGGRHGLGLLSYGELVHVMHVE
ncbi:hypothetical protein SARC_06915 [Sphaeroforma arctica JP610]|uniref:Uncharacterized protein n=1 Tax=Sphaeroforma arctica JP610 TaxID=667725 RepID=A0A0L0FVZ4_9EUKA|nr:hypothetical protein SARC_06915 [Sphaeroforma arctica JP610]KNC80731.1 hypothetical protein SARC_06915 [Sphaeroforma arctica JP610]|eukprot:XP_014154633.1 hypothetical protein SARC_06915 [Sphaeroforma arctica JP610]